MKYIVVSNFKDITDNKFEYTVGDPFPRKGKSIDEISKNRLEELTTKNNKKGKVLIRVIEENEQKDRIVENKIEEKSQEDMTESSQKEELQKDITKDIPSRESHKHTKKKK